MQHWTPDFVAMNKSRRRILQRSDKAWGGDIAASLSTSLK